MSLADQLPGLHPGVHKDAFRVAGLRNFSLLPEGLQERAHTLSCWGPSLLHHPVTSLGPDRLSAQFHFSTAAPSFCTPLSCTHTSLCCYVSSHTAPSLLHHSLPQTHRSHVHTFLSLTLIHSHTNILTHSHTTHVHAHTLTLTLLSHTQFSHAHTLLTHTYPFTHLYTHIFILAHSPPTYSHTHVLAHPHAHTPTHSDTHTPLSATHSGHL